MGAELAWLLVPVATALGAMVAMMLAALVLYLVLLVLVNRRRSR